MYSSLLRERSGFFSESLWSRIFFRNMGGGPRTFPGGLNKWQWKRMHEKKAREKESKLLDQEKQLYEARIRSEIRAKLWANHDSGEKTTNSSQSHGPMSPKEHIKSLADRFMKAGAEDLWNEDDGPVEKPEEGSRLPRRDNGRFGSNSIDSSSNSPIIVRRLVSENRVNSWNFDRSCRGFSSMGRGRFKRNESSCDEGDEFDAKLDTLSPFAPKFSGTKEKVKTSRNVNGVIKNKGLLGLFGRRKFRKNDSSIEEDSEEENEDDGKMKGWRKTGSSASLGNFDFKLTKRVNRNVTDEELYPPLDISTVREDLSKRKSVENVMEEKREPFDSIYSGKRSYPNMSLRKPQIPRLLLQNVSCMRNAQQILRHVNVSLHDGGALVLTGTNGSGKSTFLRMLAGFSKPSAGEILWNGHDITQSGIFQQYKLQLNWISLKDAIKERFTVLDNVQWFELLENKIGKAQPALELMGLGRLVKEKSRMLSMGQRKRLQLARLLAIDRPIWLLDEPSVALDDEGVRLLEYIIAEHRKKGGIVIVATHLPIEIEDAMILRLPPRFPRKMTLIDMLDRADIS